MEQLPLRAPNAQLLQPPLLVEAALVLPGAEPPCVCLPVHTHACERTHPAGGAVAFTSSSPYGSAYVAAQPDAEEQPGE